MNLPARSFAFSSHSEASAYVSRDVYKRQLESGIVQKVQTYIAPKLFGGESAKTPIEGKGFPDPASAILLKNSEIIRIGDDFLIESEVKSNVHGNC